LSSIESALALGHHPTSIWSGLLLQVATRGGMLQAYSLAAYSRKTKNPQRPLE
jgi:hypothetical protein